MCEEIIKNLEFMKPSEAIEELRQKNGNGIYFIALKKESIDIFKEINKSLYNELQERNKYYTSNGDVIIYIGQARGQGGLYKRLQQELLQVGRGIFFRSVGAILNQNPKRCRTQNPSTIRNFKFEEDAKNYIIKFMEDNFLVAYRFYEEGIDELEKNAIIHCQPIFNTQHNNNPSEEINKQRKRCRKIVGEPSETINENKYIKLMITAKEKKWCTNYPCTTCGAMDIRNALEEIKGSLFEEIMKLSDFQLKQFDNWIGCTYYAIDLLTFEQKKQLRIQRPNIVKEIENSILRANDYSYLEINDEN